MGFDFLWWPLDRLTSWWKMLLLFCFHVWLTCGPSVDVLGWFLVGFFEPGCKSTSTVCARVRVWGVARKKANPCAPHVPHTLVPNPTPSTNPHSRRKPATPFSSICRVTQQKTKIFRPTHQPRTTMETAYKVWSFSLPTRSAAEVESMTIGGADPRS